MAAGPYQIGLPEVKLGVLPGTGGTQRLPRLVGKSRGLDLIITGRLLTPEQALEMGLVDRVFPKEDLELKTMEYAQEIASGPSRTIGLIKVAVTEGIEMPLSGGLALEREVQNQLFQNQDAKEGLAAYVEKRKPKFTGR
jgi:enoyl-CoA hydratase/carnithine racemase